MSHDISNDMSDDEYLLPPSPAPAAAADGDGTHGETDPDPGPDRDLDRDVGLDEDGRLYRNVYVFVVDLLAVLYARDAANSGPVRWCSRWWEHPEAVSRLEALWLAFEELRAEEGTGPSDWWRDYADPTMAALLDAAGPFRSCGPTRHDPPPPLATNEIPAALLDT